MLTKFSNFNNIFTAHRFIQTALKNYDLLIEILQNRLRQTSLNFGN